LYTTEGPIRMTAVAMREYAGRRVWMIALQVREVGSGAAKREARERLLEAGTNSGCLEQAWKSGERPCTPETAALHGA
jgi:hypothetical protein